MIVYVLPANPIGPGSIYGATRYTSVTSAPTSCSPKKRSGTLEAFLSRERGGAVAAPRPGTSVAFVDPMLSALDGPVTWLPSRDLPVMIGRADRLGAAAEADFRAEALPGLASIHIDAAGRQHAVIKSRARRVTICIDGAPIAVAPARVTFKMTTLTGLFAAQRNVTALREIFADQPAGAPTWTTTALEKRDALIALDAHFNDASHREVAVLIFGAEKVQAEWVADGCELKDYVRRCRNRGLRYMQGGYRRLLR